MSIVDDQRLEIDVLKAELAEARSHVASLEARDAARQRRFEETLEACKRNYREIFNAAMTGICVHEIPSGRILDANQALIDMFGYSREETLSPAFWDRATLGSPYDARAAIAVINKAATEGRQTLQWPVRRANGEQFWVEVTLKQAVIGGVPCVVSLSSDITDRLRAEKQLVESQRKLSTAVSIARLGYWEYDVTNDLFTFDDHFYAVFHTTAEQMGGYTMSAARYAAIFVHPDDAHMVADEVRAAIEADDPGYSRQLEHRILYADGGTGYMAVRFYVVKDEKGRTIKTYGANQDITDRKRAEEALRASEQNYREIFDGTMNAIFVHEIPSGRVLDVNQTMLDMFGCSRDEALTMSFWKKVSVGPPYTPADAIRLIRKAVAEGQQTVQWPVRRANGDPFWVEVVVKPAIIGGAPRALVLMNDITERWRSQEALKASEQSYREIFDATMDAVFIHEIPTGRIVDVNQTMLDMYRVSRDEALTLNIEQLSGGASPYSQKEAVALVNKAANEGPQTFEWRSRRRNGETFWAEVILRRATIGGVPRVLALVRDITDRKESQQHLLEERETLRQLLESQERERRLIAYEIHDGLAQQLAAATMYCSAFDQLRESDPEGAARSHEAGAIMLQKALAEARRLISGLRPAVLDDSGLIAAVGSLALDLQAREGIEVEFTEDVRFERLDPVWENSLFRIAQESLTNAARYSGTKRIRIGLIQQADRLILEVQDWGSGFDPQKVRQECFGLKGIRERAALLGGTATIDSSLGEGTRIHVEVPM